MSYPMLTVAEAADILRGGDDFLLLAHKNPDGDAVGSVVGLYHVLKAMGKNAAFVLDTVPDSLVSFVPEPVYLLNGEPMIVALDCGSVTQVFADGVEGAENRVRLSIDHHNSCTPFAEDTLLDDGAAAACETVFDLMKELGVALTPQIAECLYVGVSTDTGCFRYSNTTARSHAVAAELMSVIENCGEINRILFETVTRDYAAFEGEILAGIKYFYDGKCSVLTVTRDMMNRRKVNDGAIQGLPGLARRIEGVLIGITLKEKKDGGFRASLRANEPFDASAVCARVGGGGHKLAAACDLGKVSAETAMKTLVDIVGDELVKQGLA